MSKDLSPFKDDDGTREEEVEAFPGEISPKRKLIRSSSDHCSIPTKHAFNSPPFPGDMSPRKVADSDCQKQKGRRLRRTKTKKGQKTLKLFDSDEEEKIMALLTEEEESTAGHTPRYHNTTKRNIVRGSYPDSDLYTASTQVPVVHRVKSEPADTGLPERPRVAFTKTTTTRMFEGLKKWMGRRRTTRSDKKTGSV